MLLTRRYHPKPALGTPIMQAEQLHLQRAAQAGTVSPRFAWVGKAGWYLGLAYLISVLLAIGVGGWLKVPAQNWWRSSFNFYNFLNGWVENAQAIILLILFVDHLIIGFATLQMASSAIARERSAGTFDLLRITLCSPRQIVRGKWRAIFPGYVVPQTRLFVYRIVLSLLLGLCMAFQSNWQAPSLLLLIPMIWAVPVLRILCGQYLAALGLLVSAFMRSEAVASRLAFGLFVVLQLGQLILIIPAVVIGRNISDDTVYLLWREMGTLLGNNIFVPLTGGFNVVLISYDGDTLPGSLLRLVAALVFAVISYGGLTWLALRLAEWRLARE